MFNRRFAVQKWVGRYQSDLIYLYGKRTFQIAARKLETFFEHFPEMTNLNELTLPDLVDYVERRKNEGASYRTVEMEIRAVRRLYTWLIEKWMYPNANPALAFAPLPFKKRKCPKSEDLGQVKIERELLKDEDLDYLL